MLSAWLQNKRKRTRPAALNAPCELGSLADLAAAGKGGLDPNGRGSTLVATDTLWSDPVREPGIELNHSRGVGTVFGPDVTQVLACHQSLERTAVLRQAWIGAAVYD